MSEPLEPPTSEQLETPIVLDSRVSPDQALEQSDEWMALKAEASRLEEELKQVQYQLHYLRSQAYEAFNNKNPKNCTGLLPNEVLNRIFLMGGRSFLPDMNREGGSGRDAKYQQRRNILPFPMMVSHVCRKWRVIAVEDPLMWTNMDIWMLHCQPQLLKHFCDLSGSAPLDMRLTYHWTTHKRVERLWTWIPDHPNSKYWRDPVDDFNFPILLSKKDQWRSLVVSTAQGDRGSSNESEDAYLVKLFDHVHAPNLQTLAFNSVIYHGNFAPDFTGSFPNLETLRIPGYMTDYWRRLLPTVKHLYLRDQHNSGNFWPVRKALETENSLLSLELHGYHGIDSTDRSDQPLSPVRFAYLTALTIGSLDLESVLQYLEHTLDMPLLSTLCIQGVTQKKASDKQNTLPPLNPPVVFSHLASLTLWSMNGAACKIIGSSIHVPALEELVIRKISLTGRIPELLRCDLTPSMVTTLILDGTEPEFTEGFARSFPHVETLILGSNPSAAIATLIRAGKIWPALVNVSISEIYNYNYVLLTDFVNQRKMVELPLEQLLLSRELYESIPAEAVEGLKDLVEWRFAVDDQPLPKGIPEDYYTSLHDGDFYTGGHEIKTATRYGMYGGDSD